MLGVKVAGEAIWRVGDILIGGSGPASSYVEEGVLGLSKRDSAVGNEGVLRVRSGSRNGISWNRKEPLKSRTLRSSTHSRDEGAHVISLQIKE